MTRKGAALQGRGVHHAARIVEATAGDEILVSASSIASVNTHYVRLEPRKIIGDGFGDPISVVPIQWQTPQTEP